MLKRNPQDRINFEDFSTHAFLVNNENENFPNSYENKFIEQQQQLQQQQQQQSNLIRKKTNNRSTNEEKFLNIDLKKKTKPQQPQTDEATG
jgi:hypothetical protein